MKMNSPKTAPKNSGEKQKSPFGKTKTFTAFTDQLFSTCFLESYQGRGFRLDPYSGLMTKN